MSERPSRAELRGSFPIRLAVWGFALIAASVVVAIAAGNATGAFAAIPPLVLLAIVVAVLLATGRGLIAGLVVAVLALLAFVVLEILTGLFLLLHPDSFADFVPALMRAVGALMAFFGTVQALRQRRRSALRPTGKNERRLLRAGAGALVAVAVLSAVLTYTGDSDADAPPGALVVETQADEFEPSEIRADAGEALLVFIQNTDSYAHTFTIDELEVDEYVGPRSERLVRFRVPNRPARLELWCAVTGHENMTGTLIVSG
jgi:hypothetical protein